MLETNAQLGWPVTTVVPLGVVLLVSTALSAFPQTSVLGAVLLTAYLGVMVGGGLYLRNNRLRAFFPFRRWES